MDIQVKYIDLYERCESVPEMVTNTSVGLHTCKNNSTEQSIYVKDPSDCIDFGLIVDNAKPLFNGIECKNGSLISNSDRCEDVFNDIFYEQDDDGKKICLKYKKK